MTAPTIDGAATDYQGVDSAVSGPELNGRIEAGGIDWQTGAPTERCLTLEGAVEELVYDLLSATHSGWQDNDGAYGEFCIGARARTIHLEFNERFTSSELFTHDF